ncbi:hypothetical protein A1D31_25075 [Bradyrhizobium liaoningense]|nr:hypothetical protein A1D31_25075 [Bradyrhizobium liaoningense]
MPAAQATRTCAGPVSGRAIAFQSSFLRPSFETPALGGLLRMRTECVAAVQRALRPNSLILRRRVSAVSKDEACAQVAQQSQMR